MLRIETDRIVFAGDWHGYLGQAMRTVQAAHKDGIKTIIHVGDFGIWSGKEGMKYLFRLNKMLEEFDMTLYFVDGNHEDFPLLYEYRIMKDGTRRVRPRIFHLPRGLVFEWNDLHLLAFGGAFSVDRNSRVLGRTWWQEETITDADIATALENVALAPKIDIMVCHDSPASVPNPLVDNPVSQVNAMRFFGVDAIEQATEHRKRLDAVYHAAKPALLIHGHYHEWFSGRTQYGAVVSLDEGANPIHNAVTVTPEDVAMWRAIAVANSD
jgi:predicted phosphodiesterase